MDVSKVVVQDAEGDDWLGCNLGIIRSEEDC
jgi:hypothetical protein